jgi:GTP-binding protein HflX
MIPQSLPKALLVGLQLPRISPEENEASLRELGRLVQTLGYQVIGTVSQKRSSSGSATVLGEGKLRELARWTGGPGKVQPMVDIKKSKAAERFGKAENSDEEMEEDDSESLNFEQKPDVIVFDVDLSPSQLRNLESATAAKVLDRTGVIIEIFSRHARTRAARLQVEIARLNYMAPRIRETGGGQDRQGGGIGGKGAGETSYELDRRRIRDRIKELKDELESVQSEQDVRRTRRSEENTVALVGYTNAGKSSLMRAMTGSEIYVADKLFATLDTTVRPLHPETMPKVLLSDTVGFIKKLPHDLVASFRSTLDEALNADLLLYVVDASDPTFRSQLEVTQTVLSEIGIQDTASRLILNKRDRLSSEECEQLKKEFPQALLLSTRDPEDLSHLRDHLVRFFESSMQEEKIFVPYTTQGAIGEIRARMRVLSENFDELGAHFLVRAEPLEIERLKRKFSI